MPTSSHPEGGVPITKKDTPSAGKAPLQADSSTTPSAIKRAATEALPDETSSKATTLTALAMRNASSKALTAVPKNVVDLASAVESTDSEDAKVSDSEAEPANKSKGHTAGSAARPKADGVKQVQKRQRTNSSSSAANSTRSAGDPAAKPARKRIRTTALQRQAPTARSELPLDNGELANFTSTIFIIQLGPNGRQFHAHESVLKRSPKFRDAIANAKRNKRATKQNMISLMAHDAVAFEQMMQYLYKDKFQLSKSKSSAIARIAEIHELFSLAKHYMLPGLQRQIVKLFSVSKMLDKITPATFFDWAEDMYHEEMDHDNGPFKAYFSQVAPTMMRDLEPHVIADICRMVKLGGGFAEELFKASHSALVLYTFIKEEGVMDTGTGDTEEKSLFVQWYSSHPTIYPSHAKTFM